MRLAHSSLLGGWAWVDEARGGLKHVAGGLSAWAPRIASGEGRNALPLTGREALLGSADPLHPSIFRRVLPGPAADAWSLGLAAVVGCSLVGRTNPFRSVVGYVGIERAANRMTFGRFLVTRDEFGDQPPLLRPGFSIHVTAREHLESFGGELYTGDLLVLGPVDLPGVLAVRLWDGAGRAYSMIGGPAPFAPIGAAGDGHMTAPRAQRPYGAL